MQKSDANTPNAYKCNKLYKMELSHKTVGNGDRKGEHKQAMVTKQAMVMIH